MEDVHRRAIQSNFVSLVEQTDLDLMVSTLYEKGVFSDQMIEKYKDTSVDVRNRKRQLYRDVMLRGPDAFRHLTDALQEAGYWNLARDLDPDSSLHTRRPQSQPSSREENSFISIRIKDLKRTDAETQKNCVLDEGRTPMPVPNEKEEMENMEMELNDNIPHFDVIKSTKFFDSDSETDIKLYRTRGRQRGVLLAFSYINFQHGMEDERLGADVDAKKLKYLFIELGFKVCSYLNLTKDKTKETLKLLNQVLAGAECVFIVVSSHGYSRDNVSDVDFRCHDGKLMSIYEFLEYFNNEQLPALIGIPKVFIFQLCRGWKELQMPLGASSSTYSDGVAGGGAGAALPPGPPGPPCPPAARPPPLSAPLTPLAALRPPRPRPPPPARLYSDILIAHSTLPGYVSKRDVRHGSWYIQMLCSVFAQYAHARHVEELFTLVDMRLHEQYQVQTSAVERWGFNKHLYLHPGLYDT
ncbi:hypothetical protein evm_013225 [Chilo suppressalis]|nr:hypothetical protein evm_013225 [Chilo suppressalis]